MKKLTIVEMEVAIEQMKRIQKEYPKAKIVFDVEANYVLITYPLPKDFLRPTSFTEEII